MKILSGKKKVGLVILLLLLKIDAQTVSAVKIKDHNGTYNQTVIDCNYAYNANGCIDLTAEYPLNKESTIYDVNSIPYMPIGNFSDGTIVNVANSTVNDDKYSTSLAIGFDFCFYAKKYNQVIIGDNATISFNTANAGGNCAASFTGGIPNNALEPSSIFAAFHDLILRSDQCAGGNCGEVRVQTIGSAPNRQFIVNYDQVSQVGSLSSKVSVQVVLYETTNIIDIYIKNKPNAGFKSIVGLMDHTKTQAVTAPNRNGTNWATTNEAWRFIPSGNSNITVEWYNQFNNLIGSGNTISVCPTADTQYKAKVKYNTCVPYELGADYNITFSQDLPEANAVSKIFCKTGNTINTDLNSYNSEISSTSNVTITYHASLNDAKNNTSAISSPYSFSSTTSLYARVLKTNGCYKTAKVDLIVNTPPNLTDRSAKLCDIANNNTESTNLYQLMGSVSAGIQLSFFSTLVDAQNNNLPIQNTTNYTVTQTQTTLYVRAVNTTDLNCFSVSTLSINLTKTLETKNMEHTICADPGVSNLADLNALIGNNLLVNPVLGVSYSFYYNSSLTSSISNTTNFNLNSIDYIYVKIIHPDFCDATASIKILKEYDCNTGGGGGGGGGGNGGGNLPQCNTTVPVYFDLMVDYNAITNNGTNAQLIGFYLSLNDAQNETSAIANFNNFEVVPNNSIDIYIKYLNTTTQIKTIIQKTLHAYHQLPLLQTDIKICDVQNDKKETIYLSQYTTLIKNLYTANNNVFYYLTQADLEADRNNNPKKFNITQFVLTDTAQDIFILQEISRGGCEFDDVLHFTLETIEVKNVAYKLCDYNNDLTETIDLADYKDQSINTLLSPAEINDIYTIGYYNSLSAAHNGWSTINSNVTVKDPSATTFYIRIDFKTSSARCFIIIALNFSFQTSVNLPLLNDLNACDSDNNGNEILDLSQSLSANLPANTSIQYFTSQLAAETNDTNYEIQTPLAYSISALNTPIYARFTDTQLGCATVRNFNVFLIKMPNLLNEKILACDALNDGQENIMISYITNQLINNNSSILNTSMTYTYYASEADAQANQSPITATLNSTNGLLFYVKIGFKGNTNCERIYPLTITYQETPKTKDVNIKICNNATKNVGGQINETINLNAYQAEILPNTSNLSNYYFTYYNTLTNAQNGVGSVASNYTVTSFPTTLYVRTENRLTQCFSISSFVVNAYPDFTDVQDNISISFCTDQTQSGIVDLNSYISSMTNNATAYDIAFYETQTNAINAQNNITNPNNYTVTPTTQVWVRFTNKTTSCFEIKNIIFNLLESPKIFPITNNVCDDDMDGLIPIDFTNAFGGQITLEIDKTIYTYEYYHTLTDAQNQQAAISTPYLIPPSDFTPISATETEKVLYLRVISKATQCVGYTTISLRRKNEVPTLNKKVSLYACDDSTNDGIENFDLTVVTPEISLASNVNYTYYRNLEDLKLRKNSILNPLQYLNSTANQETLYVLLIHDDYCPTYAEINLEIIPYLDLISIHQQASCELLNTQNAQDFDLKSFIPKMTQHINPQNLVDYTISYHLTSSDANNNLGALDANTVSHYNFNSQPSLIYVRFKHNKTQCIAISTIQVEIATISQFNVIPPPCNRDTGRIEINTTNAIAYSYDDGLTWENNAQKELPPGNYLIRVKNQYDCISPAVEVIIPETHWDHILPDVSTIDGICGKTKGSIVINSNAAEYSFDGGQTWQNTNQKNDLEEGTYQIIIKNQYGCTSKPLDVNVKISKIVLSSFKSCMQNTIYVPSGGQAPYEYSLDGINYQASQLFTNVTAGNYTLYIRDANGCIQTAKIFYSSQFKIPKAFSPNGDGINDTWNLEILQTCPKAVVQIFDRYGRSIASFKGTPYIWNGTQNGKPLPSDTYWFGIDFGDGKTPPYKSHLTIKRND